MKFLSASPEHFVVSNSREYERSHPWITFHLDLERVGPRLWGLLGQAVARCEQVAGAVLPPEAMRRLHTLHLSRGARATTAIEGNTLTEAEVLAQVEDRLDLPPSRRHLAREVSNVVAAYREITDAVSAGRPLPLTTERVCDLGGRVLDGLEEHLQPEVAPGEIRSHRVVVGRYRGAPPEDCRYLLDRLCAWLRGGLDIPVGDEGQNRLAGGIVCAVVAHLYIAWIHPFGDGNGRTARLIEYQILASAGVPAPAGHLLSNHYHRTRPDYYAQLDRASHAGSGAGDPVGFLRYAVEGFVRGLAEHCGEIEQTQADIAWEHQVHQRFESERPSSTTHRRREIARTLGGRSEPVPRGGVPGLSPNLAQMFARKTTKTLTRDLNWLIEAGLVERTGDGYRAPVEILQGWKPAGR